MATRYSRIWEEQTCVSAPGLKVESIVVDIVSSIVIEDALNSFHAGISPQPVHFYCSRNPTEPARSDPQAILASLARQLSSAKPGNPLLQPSIDMYDEEEAEGFVSGPPRLDQSLKLIMQLIELYPQTTIILDALDECDPATRLDLLRALERHFVRRLGHPRAPPDRVDRRRLAFLRRHVGRQRERLHPVVDGIRR